MSSKCPKCHGELIKKKRNQWIESENCCFEFSEKYEYCPECQKLVPNTNMYKFVHSNLGLIPKFRR